MGLRGAQPGLGRWSLSRQEENSVSKEGLLVPGPIYLAPAIRSVPHGTREGPAVN